MLTKIDPISQRLAYFQKSKEPLLMTILSSKILILKFYHFHFEEKLFMKICRTHSLIEIVWPLQLKSHCYCFCLHREFDNTAIDGTHKDQKKLSHLLRKFDCFI